jgi:hypothetical protein
MSIQKINQFPEGSGSLSNDDVFLFMDDPSGSGVTKKISLSDIASAIGGGGTSFQISTVDLHNGGVQNAQVLQFDNGSYQSVITGPTPASGNNAQRIIVQGQRAQGGGEGGDVYMWGGDAGYNGGDIKIYAGDADGNESGYGGYVNIDGGTGTTSGGDVQITAGYSDGGQAGDVTIFGGSTSSGVAGTVSINTNNNINTWTFDLNGNLNIPGNVTLPNGSTLASGTYDNSTGANNGISLNCVVGYELNWQGGRLKNTYNNGATTYPIYIDSPITYFPTVVSLGSGLSNFATDASAGEIFDFTLTQSLTIDNPINPINGKTIRWRISQDNVGNRSVSFPEAGNKFNIPSSASNPLPWSSGVNKTDLLAATYDSGRDKWDVIAFVPGY